MLIYNGVFVFYFCFSSFFCCFWAYCRPLLLLLISFFLLFLDLLSRPYCFFLLLNLITSFYCRAAQSHLQLTTLTMIIKCGIIKLAHKYKWKLRSVSLKISAFYCSQPCWLRSWYNKMGFKNIAFLKMVFFNKWKLRTISLKNSVYFFLLQPAILTLQLIYDIIKWGLFFLNKNFCSSLIYQLHMLDKIMSRRLQPISVSQLIWKIAAHLYLQLTHLYLQLTYLTAPLSWQGAAASNRISWFYEWIMN